MNLLINEISSNLDLVVYQLVLDPDGCETIIY